MNEQVILQRAIELKRAGRYDEARELYHSVIEAIPQCDPAYKGLAKLEIVSGRYEAGIRALLMKIDLGSYFTRQLPQGQFVMVSQGALRNLDTPLFNPEARFGTTVIPAGATYERSVADPRVSSVALLAWAEPDLYFYLGHCLMRMFPKAFSHYAIPEQYLVNLENALRGCPSGADARDSRFAFVFYIAGFWFAVANTKNPLSDIDPRGLRERFARNLDFKGQGFLSDEKENPNQANLSSSTQSSGGGGCLTAILIALGFAVTCAAAVL